MADAPPAYDSAAAAGQPAVAVTIQAAAPAAPAAAPAADADLKAKLGKASVSLSAVIAFLSFLAVIPAYGWWETDILNTTFSIDLWGTKYSDDTDTFADYCDGDDADDDNCNKIRGAGAFGVIALLLSLALIGIDIHYMRVSLKSCLTAGLATTAAYNISAMLCFALFNAFVDDLFDDFDGDLTWQFALCVLAWIISFVKLAVYGYAIKQGV